MLDSLPSRILFPSAESSSSAESHSSAVDPDDSPDDGASTILVQPLGHSFLDDFVPRGISGSDLLAGSTAVIHSTSSALNHTATALNTTAAAVRQMFGSSSDRQAGPKATVGPDDTPRARAPGGAPPPAPPPAPTPQQFADLQLRYAALQRRVDELASRQSAEQRARAIDDEIEQRRQAAYEAANIPYSPRRPASPPAPGAPPPLGPRNMEYRIAHKSIGYLRPADASLKPFEAVDGEVYVRPLAWLAHLRTKLELRDDFHYKNQVLQVASECLVGRAAAWWTAIGQRMRNMLLADYTLDLWHQHMQVLCQSREQTRKEAKHRSWQVDKEECWDYVWEKAALFEELEPRDRPSGMALISEMLDGLPASLARMSRTEFMPNPTVSELTRELQVLVPRWRKDFGREFGSGEREPGPHVRERNRRPLLPRAPEQLSSDRASLHTSYDKSKIGSQPHPITKRPTRCYTKPNGKVIFLSRNCSRCNEGHFDFEHEALRATANFHIDADGYEEWHWDSDTIDDDAVLSKLN